MDKTYLRSQALQIATQRAKPDASLDDILTDAKTVLAFLLADWVEPKPAEPVPAAPSQHESVSAVEGQEPKTDQ